MVISLESAAVDFGGVADVGRAGLAEAQRERNGGARRQGGGVDADVRRAGVAAAGVAQRDAGWQAVELDLERAAQRGAAGVGDRERRAVLAGGAVEHQATA